MTAILHKPIEILVKRMFPNFVSEDYPILVLFIQKVLEHMDREGGEYNNISHLLEYNDVDSTTIHFQETFKNQYLQNFPDSLSTHVDLLVKNIRSFYLSKGTEESYRFLFQALFDSTVNFKYPKFNILRASDGLWFTPQYLVLADQNNNIPPQFPSTAIYNINRLIGKFITGATTGAVAFVDNALTLGNESLSYDGDGNVRAVVLVEKEGAFQAGEQILVGDTLINNGDFSFQTNGWSLFPINDAGIYTLNNELVLEQLFGNIKPKYIHQLINVLPETRYLLRYSLVSSDYAQTRITVGYAPGTDEIHNTGNLGPGGPFEDNILLDATAVGKTKIYVSIWNEMEDAGNKAVYDGVSLLQEDTSNTPIIFIANHAGSGILNGVEQAKDKRGFLSEGDVTNNKEIFLQDNNYYQDFSYELKSTVSSDRFRNIIKDLLHPSGMKMFAAVVESIGLSTFTLRESIYTDLALAGSTITRTASGTPFTSLFRPGDVITIDDASESNSGQYTIVTVTPTVITVVGSLTGENLSGIQVELSSGMGIIDLTDDPDFVQFDYSIVFPLNTSINAEFFDLDYGIRLGFGTTWSQVELAREGDGILISSWESLIVGDFDFNATSRFGFIDSAEVSISP